MSLLTSHPVNTSISRRTHLFTVRKRSCEGYGFYRRVSVHTGGGYLSQCILGYHTPMGADTPRGRHPPGSRYPPPEQTPPRSRHPPGAETPPEQTATAADGTHPTGMHSCCYKKSRSPHPVNSPSNRGFPSDMTLLLVCMWIKYHDTSRFERQIIFPLEFTDYDRLE